MKKIYERWTKAELLKLAKWQKLAINLYIPLTILSHILVPKFSNHSALMSVSFFLWWAATSFLVFKLERAARNSLGWILFYIILIPIPFMALVIIWIMTSGAASILKKNGIRTGFFGAKMKDFEKTDSKEENN